MARQIQSYDITVPANTAASAYQTTDITFQPFDVSEIEIVIPPGPAGTVGIVIAASGSQVIPYNPGQWIITDNEIIRWPLEGFHDSGSWQVRAYNTGVFDHTIYIRFLLTPVGTGVDNSAAQVAAVSGLNNIPASV